MALERKEKTTFPRAKMVLGRKTNFVLGRYQKTIILDFGRIVSQQMFFFVFGVLTRKKLVFLPKTIFFLGKSWFFTPKPSFPWEKSRFSCPKPF